MGDAAWRPDISDEDITRSLRSKLDSDEDFQVESWKMVPMSEKLGLLGDHYRIVGSVRRPAASTQAPADFSFFVKTFPTNPAQRSLVDRMGAFRKERLFYKLAADTIAQAVPLERAPGFQPFIFPLCRLIKEDCLILDDLTPFQFKPPPVNSLMAMDLEHIEMVVAEMARLHAASLVLEERAGRPLSELYPELMYETFFTGDPDSVVSGWHQASVRLAVAIVPHLERYNKDPELVRRIQEALPHLLPQIFTAVRAWPGHRNVLNHGDLWINNLLYRYESGRPVELSLVDYQMVRYAPPAHDLVVCLLFCTDQAFQDAHLSRLTRKHWDDMAAVLRDAGCDPDKVLPWSKFKDSVDEMWKFGLVEMALEHPFSFCPTEVMDDIINDPVKSHQFFNVDRTDTMIRVYQDERFPFRQRYTETMTRLIDNYVLK